MRLFFLCCLLSLSSAWAQAPAKAKPKKSKPAVDPAAMEAAKGHQWTDWVEPGFPFFSSVLDAREAGEGFPKDNLTPRGLILNLGQNLWACFDADLLRLACVWEGEAGQPPVTAEALAPGSYHIAGQKTKDGQDFLPKPTGKVWLANGIYPGVQVGPKPQFTDPREPSASPEEVGRGSLTNGKFVGIIQADDASSVTALRLGWELQYSLEGTLISETWLAGGASTSGTPQAVAHFTRVIRVAPHATPLQLIIGKPGETTRVNIREFSEKGEPQQTRTAQVSEGIQSLLLEPSAKEVWLNIDISEQRATASSNSESSSWQTVVTTRAHLSTQDSAYVLDNIDLPLNNPWKRNVRLADITFLNDQGDAAGVTFDGDVWLISGLKGDLEKITWKRFASGLHEPMNIAAKRVEGRSLPDLYVFDRSGIWKLVDSNGDREADRYEMFCNLFGQTAETREFPNTMKLGPDGSFYISKGGQEGTSFGKHNGTVLKIAPDGKSFEVVGYGLRQPFIGVHPKTGLVTASDQQGNYVPSTPLHIIEKNQFYGHLPTIAPKEQYPAPITEPVTWIPHPVNPSGASQTWLVDAKMGPINEELIHLGYNRPELFRVMFNHRFSRPQAAVMSFNRAVDFGPLNASVNPADGQLYVTGFQVWGTTAKKISGLARLRYTGKPRVLLKEVTPTDKGLILRFNERLDPALATNPAHYNAERWNYKRTPDYGSPHLKLDGSTGQEWVTPSSAYLSQDGYSVFVGIPDMKAGVHQMRIGWDLKSVRGLDAANTAYFSPWELAEFDPVKEGFGNITVDLTPRQAVATAQVKPSVAEGAKLYQMIGCMACHSTDGSTVGKVGPSWKGLFGSERQLAKGGKSAVADEAYLRESILDPNAKVVKGFEKFDTGMPIYAGILNESQVESLVLFIKTLK